MGLMPLQNTPQRAPPLTIHQVRLQQTDIWLWTREQAHHWMPKPLVPRPGHSSLQNCEKFLLFISHSVYSVLLCSPKGLRQKLIADLSSETMEAGRQWDGIFKVLKEKKKAVNQEIYIWQNCSSKIKDIPSLPEFCALTNKVYLQKLVF